MSFRADLTLVDSFHDGKSYRVLSCSHTLSVDTDISNRPSSRPRFGKIDLEIESSEDIAFWVDLASTRALNGKVVFKKRDEEEVQLKTLVFEDAFVVEHTERFHADGELPMILQFTLSAGTLKMESTNGESAEINNDWVGRERS